MEKSPSQLSKDEKIAFLNRIIEGDDYTTDLLPVFQEFLDDPDAEVRKLAISGLWDYPVPEMIDELMSKATDDPSQEVRSRAIVTLGRYIYEGNMADYGFNWGQLDELMREEELPEADFLRVKDFLLRLAKDETLPLDSQRFAIEALSFLSDPEVVELIEKAYAHPDTKMKTSALFAMGRQGGQQWREIILREIDNPIGELQLEAVRAAGESFLEEAAPKLMKLAETDDKNLRMEAIWALGKTGGDGVEEFLESCAFDDLDPDIREVAQAAQEELAIFTRVIDEDDLMEFGDLDLDEIEFGDELD